MGKEMSKILKFGNFEDGADNKQHRDNRIVIHQDLLLGIYVKTG